VTSGSLFLAVTRKRSVEKVSADRLAGAAEVDGGVLDRNDAAWEGGSDRDGLHDFDLGVHGPSIAAVASCRHKLSSHLTRQVGKLRWK
jgi:hypothetical protein